MLAMSTPSTTSVGTTNRVGILHNPVQQCTQAPLCHNKPCFSRTPAHRPNRSVRMQARRRDPIVAPVVPLGGGEEYTDMMGYLLRNRIVFVGGRITDQTATQVVAQLLALEAIDDQEEIKLYINSPGAISYAALTIVDAMTQLKCPISTVAFGICGSVSSLILAAGTKGRRYSMPNARIMLRQAMGGAQGSAFEVTITASELNHTNQVINLFYQRFTGLPLETVEEETDRENYMTPDEAKKLGLIDAVLV